MLTDDDISDERIAKLAVEKFKLVKQGQANRIDQIESHLKEFAETYDDVIPELFPNAPSYEEAIEIVWPRIKDLVP